MSASLLAPADAVRTGTSTGRRGRLTARYLRAVGHELGGGALTPAVLARAAVRVLPVDGASLFTFVDQLRTPLGSSSDDLARAEDLSAGTPVRAVASIPLRVPGGRAFAVLDLWTTGRRAADTLDLGEIEHHVAAPAAALLTTCLDDVGFGDLRSLPPEWHDTAVGRRHDAWVTIGMLMAKRSGCWQLGPS